MIYLIALAKMDHCNSNKMGIKIQVIVLCIKLKNYTISQFKG